MDENTFVCVHASNYSSRRSEEQDINSPHIGLDSESYVG